MRVREAGPGRRLGDQIVISQFPEAADGGDAPLAGSGGLRLVLPGTVVSSANRWWDGWPVWTRMQDELAALSSDAVHMTAVNAGHNVHLDEPALVVQAIRELVERCRDRIPGGRSRFPRDTGGHGRADDGPAA